MKTAYQRKSLPQLEDNFPVPKAGRSEGLTVVLDAHTDIITSSSVYDDFEGFYAVVDSKNQVPNHISFIYDTKNFFLYL